MATAADFGYANTWHVGTQNFSAAAGLTFFAGAWLTTLAAMSAVRRAVALWLVFDPTIIAGAAATMTGCATMCAFAFNPQS